MFEAGNLIQVKQSAFVKHGAWTGIFKSDDGQTAVCKYHGNDRTRKLPLADIEPYKIKGPLNVSL